MSKSILLIDDDFNKQDIFIEAVTISRQAIKFYFANNAKQGLRLPEIISPQFIFFGIYIPGMNGFQCLTEIKKKLVSKNTPVIMYSTAVGEAITAMTIASGAAACLKKIIPKCPCRNLKENCHSLRRFHLLKTLSLVNIFISV